MTRLLFLALVALLVLHTVFLRVEIAVRPSLVLLVAVVALEVWYSPRVPWSKRALVGLAVFLGAVLIIGLGTGWAEPGLQDPHNMWLQLLAETGVVGALGFFYLLGAAGRLGGF